MANFIQNNLLFTMIKNGQLSELIGCEIDINSSVIADDSVEIRDRHSKFYGMWAFQYSDKVEIITNSAGIVVEVA